MMDKFYKLNPGWLAEEYGSGTGPNRLGLASNLKDFVKNDAILNDPAAYKMGEPWERNLPVPYFIQRENKYLRQQVAVGDITYKGADYAHE
jgi:hypothetical protein